MASGSSRYVSQFLFSTSVGSLRDADLTPLAEETLRRAELGGRSCGHCRGLGGWSVIYRRYSKTKTGDGWDPALAEGRRLEINDITGDVEARPAALYSSSGPGLRDDLFRYQCRQGLRLR